MRAFLAGLTARKASSLEEFVRLVAESEATHITVESRKSQGTILTSAGTIYFGWKYSTVLTAEIEGERNISADIPHETSMFVSEDRRLAACRKAYYVGKSVDERLSVTPVLFVIDSGWGRQVRYPMEVVQQVYENGGSLDYTTFATQPELGHGLPRKPSQAETLPRAVSEGEAQ